MTTLMMNFVIMRRMTKMMMKVNMAVTIWMKMMIVVFIMMMMMIVVSITMMMMMNMVVITWMMMIIWMMMMKKKAEKEVTDIVYDEKLHGADDEHGSDYGEDDEQETEESEKPNESEGDSNVVTRKTFYQALIIPQEMQIALKGGGSFVEEIKKEKKGDCEVVYCDRPEMFCGVGGGTCSSKFSCNGNKCECKVDVTCNEEVDEIV